MAIHIQMSEEAEREMRRAALRNKISSLLACLLLVGGGGLILTLTVVLIASEAPAEFLAYVAPAENLPPQNEPTTQQLSSKASSPSTDVSPSVIVSTSAAPVAMAEVDIPMDDSMDVGVSMDLGMGLGDGLGDGLGEGGEGLGSGSAGGSALVGTFYDLKQTKSGAPSGLTGGGGGTHKVMEVLNNFLKNWSEASLNKYYKSPNKLYASSFFLPVCKAAYGPKAYGVGDKVKEGAWVAVYRGKVRAPKSGKFRFIGTGDECLAVRFNRKLVLEAGYHIPTRWSKEQANRTHVAGASAPAYWKEVNEGKDKIHKGYERVKVNGLNVWNNDKTELGGLTAGQVFEVEEGNVYPIEVMVTEVPGGKFGVLLLIDDLSEGMKYSNPANKYHLFRTNFSTPNEKSILDLIKKEGCNVGNTLEVPQYNQDSLIWVAVP